MIDLVDLIVYSVLLLLSAASFVLYVRTKVKSAKLTSQLGQSVLDMSTILDKMEKDEERRKLENSDGFVRFLSESREWAFDYIERVQESISDAVSTIEDVQRTRDVQKLSSVKEKLRVFLPDPDNIDKV
jgi:hypothetical protein